MAPKGKGSVLLIRSSYQFKKQLAIYQKIHPVLYSGKVSDMSTKIKEQYDINIPDGSGYTHYIIYDPLIDNTKKPKK